MNHLLHDRHHPRDEPEERDGGPHIHVHYVSPAQRTAFDARRQLNLACGILGCCCIGAIYAVGILSNGLQRVFGLSQDNMTTIVSVGFLMAYFVWPAGWLMDVAGPRAVTIVATALCVLGWLLFTLMFTGDVFAVGSDALVPFLSLVCAFFFWTAGFFDSATMLTNLFIFPLDRGTIVMIQKTFMSLASTVVSLTYDGFFMTAKQKEKQHDHHHHDTNSTNNSNDDNQAEGIDSDLGRGMLGYCAAFTVIALFWGVSAILGVREAPALAMKRAIRNAEKKKAAAAAPDDFDDADGARNREATPLLVDAASSSVNDAGDAGDAGDDDDEEEDPSSPMERKARSTHDGLFLCYATDCGGDDDDDSRRREWCTQKQFDSDPRIEVALQEAFPMPPQITAAAFAILAVNFVFLSTTTLVGIYVDISDPVRYFFAIFAHALVLAFFLLPVLSRWVWPAVRGARVVVGQARPPPPPPSPPSPPQKNVDAGDTAGGTVKNASHHLRAHATPDAEVVLPVPYRETFRERIRSADCWIFWLAMCGVSSTGGTLVGSAWQLFDSLARNELDGSAPTLNIGLMGIGGAAGRVLIGALEQYVLTPRRLSASLLLPLPSAVAAVGCALLPLLPPNALWLGFFLVSAGYGMNWAALLLTARQMFTVDVAQNYLFIFSAGILAVPLSRGVLGPWYDAEVRRQGAAPGKCVGVACVSLPVAVMAAMCALGAACCVWTHQRWMRRNGLGFWERVPVVVVDDDDGGGGDDSDDDGYERTSN